MADELFRNQGLFSDHYLRERMHAHPEWAEDIAAPLAQVRSLYDDKRGLLQSANENQTEAEFLRPVLDLLGYAFIPQTVSIRQGRRSAPDYALFADEKTKRAAAAAKDDLSAFYRHTLAIAEAKYWDRPLDKASPGDTRDTTSHDNPSFQVVDYLVGTGVPWGILTNGRVWRLYYERARGRATTFYEVDLVDLLESGDPAAFRYFYLFFRKDALTPDSGGRCFLDRVLEQSARYTTAVQDSLKKVVFDQVMPLLAKGFLAWRRDERGIAAETPETLEDIYRATLTLLYRLLFLLYAEARDLLPVNEPGYYRCSLTQLKSEIAQDLDNRVPYSVHNSEFWGKLNALFHMVNRGAPDIDVPTYNGDLFRESAGETEVDGLTLPDTYLAPALELLTRRHDPDLQRRVAIDYKDLEVRQLGSIYEGLLEFHLSLNPDNSEISLTNDKGERKATGSYYTPDYIVDYIITHTLGPLMEERAARFAERMKKIAILRKQLKGAGDAAKNKLLRDELERAERQAADALLDVKVCDPAMGSGHFLVRAVDFLADEIIHILGEYPENPILRQIDATRRQIAENLQQQGIKPNMERLSDTNLLRRAVMKRCVYGVDLNPMAVELAKVSLWLHSFTVGAPLSFLDHHLRCGNSLIGARVDEVDRALRNHEQTGKASKTARQLAQSRKEELREAPPAYQGALWGGPFAGLLQAAEFMRGVGALSDATVAEVGESERLFNEYDRQARPYKQLLDVYLSQHFGVKHADEFLRLYGTEVLKAGPDTVGEPFATVMREARRLYEEKRFFHWDLEFPEVFIDLERAAWKENPGFDAVVGNPPYDELSEVALGREITERAYLEDNKAYVEATTYRINLYRLFIARAIEVARRSGTHGYIVPMSLLGDRFTYELRRKLLADTTVLCVEVFPQKDDPRNRIFFDAKLPTCVYVLQRVSPSGRFRVRTHPGKDILDSSPSYCATAEEIADLDPENFTIPIVGEAEWTLAKKLAENPRFCRLGDVAQPMSGEVVFNKSFRPYLSDNPQHTLVLRGGHIQRYEVIDDPKQGSPVYIDMKKWLGVAGDGTSAFAHTRERVVYQESAALDNWRRIIATLLPAGNVCGHKICYLPEIAYDNLAFLAVFSSRTIEWRFRLVSMTNSLSAYQLSPIPFPRISFTTPKRKRAALVKEGIALYQGYLASGDAAPALAFVGERLSAEPEQSDVIHDLLAHLAEQMIAMNKEKQAEVKGFLAWLERETGAPVDALTGKSRVQGYLGDYQKGEPELSLDDLLDVLKKNVRRLKADPSAREFQETLAREYAASLGRLLPFKGRLAATDRLIDLIVYRLYGLTDEEIAVVEGRSG